MSSSSIKPFLAGAITALSAVWLVQRLLSNKKTSSSSRLATSSPSTNNTILFDSPYLEERMIRKAEAAVRGRTSRLIIVVERCTNDHNYSAILRTAEALGIQHIYIISPPNMRNDDNNTTVTSSTGKVVKKASSQEVQERAMHHLFAQRATEWLDVQEFQDTASCLKQIKQQGYQVWATDLSQHAVCLTKSDLKSLNNNTIIPEKLAIVFGTEAVGCTQEMLEGADLRVYLPLRGFADSLNLSVATALVIQQLFVLDPTLIGAMSEAERRTLREEWFSKLAMQRLLTSSQKRHKTRLQGKLKNCQQLQHRFDQGDVLQPEQEKKLQEMAVVQQELEAMNAELAKKAQIAVADLVDHPPEPITDMRRADEHRTCYVGKKTKKRNEEAWENMPATSTSFNTKNGVSSADYFRKRAAGETTKE